MKRTIIVRYGELALKSEPVRRYFERRLRTNMNFALRGIAYKLRRERGRLYVDTSATKTAIKRLVRVPGIVSVSPAVRLSATLADICSGSLKIAKRVLKVGESFAVRTTRVGKHTFSSKDVNVTVGSAILKAIQGVHVNLSNPDREISIEVRERDAYVFTDTVPGAGGLPVGVEGNVVALLSGDIDSAVATYLVMKRGCKVFPVFLDSTPYAAKRARARAISVTRRLAESQPKLEFRVLPFGQVLRTFIAKAPRGLTCVLCKRAMVRVAEAIAREVNARAVVMGDSLKPVSSQTLPNLRLIDEACGLPILRPLVGLDKARIGQMAHSIEIFASLAPCLAAPPRPQTRAKLAEVLEAESKSNLLELVGSTLKKVRVLRF
jgi:thiamine biosynthesis protein ThiI